MPLGQQRKSLQEMVKSDAGCLLCILGNYDFGFFYFDLLCSFDYLLVVWIWTSVWIISFELMFSVANDI
jgi:hypothetical protein